MNYKFKELIKKALKEDIGKKDITTQLLIPNKVVKAVLLAKEDFLVCGLDFASQVFKTYDPAIKFIPKTVDGKWIKKGKILALIEGKARSILSAERVALNFLSLLSGIATKTSIFIKKIKPFKVKIMDTRKTLPLLRDLEKYAVRIGGGFNHRFKLDEMVLIKDNHLKIINSKFKIQNSKDLKLPSQRLKEIVERLRKKLPKSIKIEIEVKNLKEFKEALKAKPDIIMLDNMSLKNIKEAVKLRKNLPVKLEASGGINLKNIRKIASTKIDMISVGELTHSIKSVDISLEIL